MRSKLAVCRCLTITLSLFWASSARTDEPLRWKFNMGAQLSYNIVQEMTLSTVEQGADKLQSKTRQELDVTWRIKSANEAGDGVVEYKFDRIRSQMTLPNGHLEYDTAKEGPPAGMAAINAPLYSALVKSPVEITIASTGAVKSVTLPEAVKAAIKKVQTASTFGDFSKPEVFQTSFLPGFPTFPTEPVKPKSDWSAKTSTDLGSGGTQTLETDYHVIELEPMVNVAIARRLSFAPGAVSKREVKEQNWGGELKFQNKAGYLDRLSLMLKTTVTVASGNAKTDQKLDQTIEVKFVAPKR